MMKSKSRIRNLHSLQFSKLRSNQHVPFNLTMKTSITRHLPPEYPKLHLCLTLPITETLINSCTDGSLLLSLPYYILLSFLTYLLCFFPASVFPHILLFFSPSLHPYLPISLVFPPFVSLYLPTSLFFPCSSSLPSMNDSFPPLFPSSSSLSHSSLCPSFLLPTHPPSLPGRTYTRWSWRTSATGAQISPT